MNELQLNLQNEFAISVVDFRSEGREREVQGGVNKFFDVWIFINRLSTIEIDFHAS